MVDALLEIESVDPNLAKLQEAYVTFATVAPRGHNKTGLLVEAGFAFYQCDARSRMTRCRARRLERG